MHAFHTFALLASAVLTSAHADAQITWQRQAPIPTPNGMALAPLSAHSLVGVTANRAGGSGEAVRSDDGGRTWSVLDLPTNSVWAVDFVDATHGWAAGNGFFHTTDGGRSWVQDNTWGTIYDIFFLDRTHGWACGNDSVSSWSDDGGLSWHAVSTPAGSTMSSIWFVDASLGFAVGISGRIVRSQDGGRSWTTVYSDPNDYLSTVQFFDALEGWAIGGDAFLHTVDGGQTWSRATVPTGTWSHGARFVDRRHGISVGETGNITTTEDGGTTWFTRQPMGSGQRLWDVEYATDRIAYAGGEAGTCLVTYDRGRTWSSLSRGAGGFSQAMAAVDARHAWSSHSLGEVARTTDGGRTWQRGAVTGFNEYGSLLGINFADRDHGWVCGIQRDFAARYGRVARSNDGGRGWLLQLDVLNVEFRDVYAVDANTAVVVAPGLVLRTVTGGTSWSDITPPNARTLWGVFFLDARTGWVVGDAIYRTDNGGSTWTVQFQAGAAIADIGFVDANTGWAVGYGDQILRTTDGGATWTPQHANTPRNLTAVEDIAVIDAQTALVAGWYGYVAKTTDGGITWTPLSVPGIGDSSMAGVAFVDGETGWIGGPDLWAATPTGRPTAAYVPFGSGCAGHRLLVDDTTPPVLGTTVTARLAGPPAGQPAALLLGTSFAFWNGLPLPFALDAIGMSDCTLWVSGDTALAFDPTTQSVALAIPNRPVLTRRPLLLQAIALHPGANPADLSASQAVEAHIGSR